MQKEMDAVQNIAYSLTENVINRLMNIAGDGADGEGHGSAVQDRVQHQAWQVG